MVRTRKKTVKGYERIITVYPWPAHRLLDMHADGRSSVATILYIRASVDALCRDGAEMRGGAHKLKSFQTPRIRSYKAFQYLSMPHERYYTRIICLKYS